MYNASKKKGEKIIIEELPALYYQKGGTRGRIQPSNILYSFKN